MTYNRPYETVSHRAPNDETRDSARHDEGFPVRNVPYFGTNTQGLSRGGFSRPTPA